MVNWLVISVISVRLSLKGCSLTVYTYFKFNSNMMRVQTSVSDKLLFRKRAIIATVND